MGGTKDDGLQHAGQTAFLESQAGLPGPDEVDVDEAAAYAMPPYGYGYGYGYDYGYGYPQVTAMGVRLGPWKGEDAVFAVSSLLRFAVAWLFCFRSHHIRCFAVAWLVQYAPPY